MTQTGGIRAGRAFVELLADDSALRRGLQRAQRMLAGFGARVRNIGAVVAAAGASMAAPFLLASKVFQKMGDDLAKMSLRTGISVESLSELSYAAGQSGADIDTLEKSVKKMQQTIIDGERGLSTAVDAFDELGLSVQDLLRLNPEQQFLAIGEALSKIEDPTRRAATAAMIFGRAGTRLLPLLQDGAAGVAALREEARRLGLTVSTEAAQRAEVLGDRIDDVRKIAKAAAFAVGDALAPAMITAAKKMIVGLVIANKWVQANREIVLTAAKIAAGVLAAGLAITTLGVVFLVAGAAIGGVLSVMSAIGAVLGAIITVAAAIATPIGIATVAVVGLGAAILRWTGAGGAALRWLAARFGELAGVAREAAGAIGTALAGGDIRAAAEVLWAGLRLAWLRGTADLNAVWLTVRDFFVSTAQSMWYGAVKVLYGALHAIDVAWIETTSTMLVGWIKMVGGLKRVWAAAVNYLAKRFLDLQGIFDKSLDVEAAKQIIDDQARREADEAKENTALDVAAAQSRGRTRVDQAGELHRAALAQAAQEFAAARRGLDAASSAQEDAAAERLRQATEAYERAVAAAKATPSLGAEGIAGRIQDLLDGLGAASSGFSSRGTFSAAAIRDLGTGVEDRQLEALRAVVDNTKRIARNTEENGPAFD